MYDALRGSGRDILFSLSNNMNITNGATIGKIANSWRTTGDIKANWNSMSQRGFGQDKWRLRTPASRSLERSGHAGNRHGPERNQPGLKPDEEYTHMTLWCLLCAPCCSQNDLSNLDAFTHNLLENDEVLAVSQDSLGDQAVTVAKDGDARVYAKKLEDGSHAVGLFNTGTNGTITVTVNWERPEPARISCRPRDLWRQKDLGNFKAAFSLPVAPHSAELVKIAP